MNEQLRNVILSVITVTYNCKSTIEKTIQSVISQMSCDIEYIIIDGNSTDGTKDVISKYSEKLSYWISENDDGIYDAMNKGVVAAKGDWITFLNGNDWYLPGILERTIAVLKTINKSICYGYVKAIKDGKDDGYMGISGPTDIERIHFGNLYCHQGLFIKRYLFEKIGLYDTKYKVYADHDWIIKAHEIGYDPYIMGFEVAYFSLGGISSQTQFADEERSVIIRHCKEHDTFPTELEKYRGKADFEIMINKSPELFSPLFNIAGNVYLWGNGKNGFECYTLINKLNLSIKSVVVSKPKERMWNGEKVISADLFFKEILPSEETDYRIIIATMKYEKEISEIMKNKGIDSYKYIKMTDIYKWAYEHNI